MSNLRADCSQCCGLCCVVPDHLEVQGFPVDKPAHVPCVQLDEHQRCSIHSNRRSCGYSACETFDCFGAGQWITQRLFEGATWTDSAETAQKMFAAYRHWVPRFEAAAMIEAALPYVRAGARWSLHALMDELTSADNPQPIAPNGSGQLQREVITRLRAALPVESTETRDGRE